MGLFKSIKEYLLGTEYTPTIHKIENSIPGEKTQIQFKNILSLMQSESAKTKIIYEGEANASEFLTPATRYPAKADSIDEQGKKILGYLPTSFFIQLENMVAKSGNANYCFQVAKSFKEADIEVLRQVAIDSKIAAENYEFAKQFPDSRYTLAHSHAVINSNPQDPTYCFYNIQFAKEIPGADVLGHCDTILEYGSYDDNERIVRIFPTICDFHSHADRMRELSTMSTKKSMTAFNNIRYNQATYLEREIALLRDKNPDDYTII